MKTGERIRSVIFEGDPGVVFDLEVVNEYHGDYDIDWGVRRDSVTGAEIERYNLRYALQIIWDQRPAAQAASQPSNPET